jgi:pimeloyl-ACP methyl ester carboxylesterase
MIRDNQTRLWHLVFAVIGAFLCVLSPLGCTHAPRFENQSHYVRNESHDRVLVFVHGLTGSAIETWQCPGRRAWTDELGSDAASDGWDIFVADYQTRLLGNHVTIEDLSGELQNSLAANGVWKHKTVAFVTHSLGGLVVTDLLLRHRENTANVSFLYLFGVPQNGAQIASLGKVAQSEKLIRQLNYKDADLQVMEAHWTDAHFGIKRYCAFETEPYGVLGVLVPEDSATLTCNEKLGIQTNHVDLVKPCSRKDQTYMAVINALNTANNQEVTMWTRLSALPGAMPDALQKSAAEPEITGKADPLGPIARAHITRLRKESRYLPPDVDRVAFYSPAYKAGVVPHTLRLPAGLKAVMSIMVVEERPGASVVTERSLEVGERFEWSQPQQGTNLTRFIVFIYPLSAEAYAQIKAEAPEHLITLEGEVTQ